MENNLKYGSVREKTNQLLEMFSKTDALSSSLYSILIKDEYTRQGDLVFVLDIEHTGLGVTKVLKDKDMFNVYQKTLDQFDKWALQWDSKERTATAQYELGLLNNILHHTLDIDHTFDWSSLEDKSEFQEKNPMDNLEDILAKITLPRKPVYHEEPDRPNQLDYQPKVSLFDKLTGKEKMKIEKAMLKYQKDLKNWEEICSDIQTSNKKKDELYNKQLEVLAQDKERIKDDFLEQERAWNERLKIFYQTQDTYNDKIVLLKESYLSKEPIAIIKHTDLVLNTSKYPSFFPENHELDFNPITKLMVVDYQLPSPKDLPRLKEVKYILSKNELRELFISNTEFSNLYDKVIYEVCLRTIHEIFESDVVDAIDTIGFNGYVKTINKATGIESVKCIISVHTSKEEFLRINLGKVEPKACFRNLKGIGSSSLIDTVAIQPIIQINKEDKRFVNSYKVSQELNEGYNVAIMDWKDFENLVCELFEKEFCENGGEVKITQASRDGGVDAIAFDPDPIRGGKIVIQAKRYTNTVGVSAVRDLYGTVMNEGATKGILVTTADYGPDAYEFIKNKPLTLLNGSNLLFLLEKHGHKARIDLAEAKRLQIPKSFF